MTAIQMWAFLIGAFIGLLILITLFVVIAVLGDWLFSEVDIHDPPP